MYYDLTLKEKIGQMLIVGMNGTELDDRITDLIVKYKVGGIILYRKNFVSYSQMIKLISELKTLNATHNKVPLFIAIDQEGGRVNRMPPELHNIKDAYSLSKMKSINLVKEAAEITATMLHESGYNMDFAPVLDVLSDKTSRAIGNRCYGSNSEEVSLYAMHMMNQLQKHKVISVVKHFPGQGAAKVDSHYLLPHISKIDERDIQPFVNAINRGVDAMMVGHMIVKDISRFCPASLSKKMVRLIRLKYKFRGVIITDDLKMRAIRYLYGTKRALKKAFLAGNDLVVFRFNRFDEERAIKNILKLAEKGKIRERRITRSVARILELKEKYEVSDELNFKGCNIEEINARIDAVNTFFN